MQIYKYLTFFILINYEHRVNLRNLKLFYLK